MPETKHVNVVFEYLSGDYVGGRFFSFYPPEELERVRKETAEPGSDKKIAAEDVSDEEAQRMCREALPGVLERKTQQLQSELAEQTLRLLSQF